METEKIERIDDFNSLRQLSLTLALNLEMIIFKGTIINFHNDAL